MQHFCIEMAFEFLRERILVAVECARFRNMGNLLSSQE
jgi:hypothetical protein